MENALSHIQRQFFVNTKLYPESTAYTINSLVEMRGRLDISCFYSALERLLTSIPILRSSFVGDGELQAIIDGDRALFIVELDCVESEVPGKVQSLVSVPFSLANAPLVRVFLLKIHGDLNYLLISQHHLVTDLFSKDLIFTILARCYKDPSFTPVIEPYSVFVDAERNWLETPAAQKSRAYWSAKMSGQFEPLRLPGSRLRQRAFTGEGEQLPWELPDKVIPRIHSLPEEGKSSFLWLLAVYASLLFRLTGQRDFMLGVPFTNRLAIVDRPVVGPCVNILPVRVSIDPECSILVLYEILRAEMLQCHRHQGYPFMEIARLYKGEHDPLRPWLLQAGFTREPLIDLLLPGLECRPVYVERAGSQMDLYFTWWESGRSLAGTWEYNSGSFHRDDCVLWISLFNRLLAESFDNQELPVSALRFADPDLVRQFAHGEERKRARGELLVTDLLCRAYARHADKEALVFRGSRKTYALFSEEVKKGATYIRDVCGVRSRVVVCLERSSALVIALHSIILSGNAYVPIGVDWPLERIGEILRDIEPSLVITEGDRLGKIVRPVCPVVTIDTVLASLPSGSTIGWPEAYTDPEDLFYVLYTSGSTGKPKGVAVPHSGIANHLVWIQERYPLSPGERCVLKTTYTFDVSVWELFWPLINGACLIVADEQQPKDPREILELACAERANRLNFVPSLLEVFIAQDGLDRLRDLHHVNCIGETLSVDLAERFRDKLPQVALHNLYGPTEASVSVSDYDCIPADTYRGTVPIGLPMHNTQLYVVDECDRPCPPLVRGELLIGGMCLAKGYWNRPELTAERFIPNPFGPGILYRTGDWCRYGLDGSLEYLERKDTQTKFRGIRLELGEIEAYLLQVPAIEQCVVRKGRDSSGQECLIAYYKERDGKSHSVEGIREILRKSLPEALVPGYFRQIPSFPMNDNGKIDRKALSDFVAFEPVIISGGAGSGLDGAIAMLWSECIGTVPADYGVNFFDTGGNSMSLLALRGLLERKFGVTLKVAELFGVPTVGGMSRLVATRLALSGPDPDEDTRTARSARRRDSLEAVARRVRDIRS